MESQKCLGIYISKNSATVVCLDALNNNKSVMGCFSVSLEDQEQADIQTLVGLVAQGCSQRGFKFSIIQVALDCSMVMQHSVRSEFSDPRQIRATVRFDTEDALATDISEVGLAFEVTSTDQDGSELTVFTVQKSVLLEILSALQSYNLDPVNMEPDINCLSRFINNTSSTSVERMGTLYGMLSNRTGYLILPPSGNSEETQKAPIVRTFMIGSSQDRNQLISREILVTVALAENKIPINRLMVFDSQNSIDGEKLKERVGIEEGSLFDFSRETTIEPQAIEDCESQVDFAIAYGAALANSEKTHIANFRDDFSPYLGNKMRMQKALKFAAISITALLLAVGIFFQMQLFRINKDSSQLRDKFAKDYSTVALEKLEDEKTFKDAVRDLRGSLRRVEAEKKGISTGTDKNSISSKLTMILTAFNKCAAKTDLNIKTVSITTRNINVTGDTSSRTNTSELFEEIRNNDLEIVQQNISLKGNRDSFSILVEPK